MATGKYVDGFVLAAPKNKMTAYRRLAVAAGKVFMRHGALGYFECAGDDLNPAWTTLKFPKMVTAKTGETVMFSFIIYKSRAHRDKVNAVVMKEFMAAEAKKKKKEKCPFDVKRMAYGGFKVIVAY